MKILHTSDWHLGKRLNERERMAEQIEVMDEIVRIAGEERVDGRRGGWRSFRYLQSSGGSHRIVIPYPLSVGRQGTSFGGGHCRKSRFAGPDRLSRRAG